MLAASGIAPKVIEARRCRSIIVRADLGRLGFSEPQRRVPALLFPLYDIHGENTGYQVRADEPRIVDGKPVKYEIPRGALMQIDVPPGARAWLADPARPLFITEGVKKADSAVSRDLCCIDLLGVWSWRGTNEFGGKTALPEWELIALNDREVYIVFDSDVMVKQSVYLALERLRKLLKSRHARVHVIYIPHGEGGTKVGLDDYFAQGHSVEDLLTHATDELRKPPVSAQAKDVLAEVGFYREREDGIYQVKERDGNEYEVRLTNFRARIIEEIEHEDGSGERRSDLRVHVTLGTGSQVVAIPGSKFSAMNWPIEALGPRAIVEPGVGTKDHARAAIQKFSGTIIKRTVYGCTGWMSVDRQWVYLHGGGAIGPDGPVPGINVELPGALAALVLPHPPVAAELVEAIRASLDLLKLTGNDAAGDAVMVPTLGLVYRAPCGRSDLSGHIAGDSGGGKSEIAACAGQHYGSGFDRTNLLGWSSTANLLEVQAFHAKDALLVVDDFVPQGTAQDQARMHQQADRLFRAVGNGAGRGRLRPDGTPRAPKGPRGIVLSTGEDVPRGRSCQARIVFINVPKPPKGVAEPEPGTMRWEILTAAQRQGAKGVFAQATAGYVRWLAGRHDQAMKDVASRFEAFREKARGFGPHARDPEKVAHLAVGWDLFLDYAVEEKAITNEQSDAYRERVWAALASVAQAQSAHQRSSDPVVRLFDLLAAAIGAGEAHICGPKGGAPVNADRWGWVERTFGTGENARTDAQGRGKNLGWVDGESLYLLPDIALKVANGVAVAGDGITVSAETMGRRLKERGLLLSVDEKRQRNTVRPTLAGGRQRVWHLRADRLLSAGHRPNRPTDAGPTSKPAFESDNGNGTTVAASTLATEPAQQPAQSVDEAPAAAEADYLGGDERDGWDGHIDKESLARDAPIGAHTPSPPQTADYGRLQASQRAEATLEQTIRSGSERDIRAAWRVLADLTSPDSASAVEREIRAEQAGAAHAI